jgi:excinuclease UvrABC helicase subunit UvrB
VRRIFRQLLRHYQPKHIPADRYHRRIRSINEEIERLRLSTTFGTALPAGDRIASALSSIYLGSPNYMNMLLTVVGRYDPRTRAGQAGRQL